MALIEDIDYLLEHSEANSLTIFIDSRNRSFAQFPSASSYVVDFEQPIRNVFGLEILDASLPVTMYNVDVNTNSLAISYLFPSMGYSYLDFQSYLTILGNCAEFDELFSEKVSANFLICSVYSHFNSMDQVVDAGGLSNNMIIYVGQCPIDYNGQYTVTINDTQHTISDATMYSLFFKNSQYSSFYASGTTIYYFEWKWCIDSQVEGYIATLNTPGALFDFYLCNSYSIAAQTGNYNSDTLISYLNTSVFTSNRFVNLINPNISLSLGYFDPVVQGASSITSLLKWTYTPADPTKQQFILDMKKSTMNCLLGFSSVAQPNQSTYSQILYKNNMQLFGSVLKSDMTAQEIVTPGIINLESARFILLRCPEIENQMLGSYGNFKYSPGISLFKMTDTSSMQQLRFDFVNIVRRPFHPIGKLPKITLRFENQDGSLYDFKGVDHQILMSIKYYSPKNVTRVPHSLLNPHYNPNLLEYKYKNHTKSHGSAKPLEEDDIQNIILEQQKYFPASL